MFNPQKLRIEEEKLEVERQRIELAIKVFVLEKSSSDMKDFIKQSIDNQQTLFLLFYQN